MQKIVTVCGSTRSESRNMQLLKAIKDLQPGTAFINFDIATLPLYHPYLDQNPLPKIVSQFKSAVVTADALIVSTPEYLSNIPAVLKNALEWLKSGGELRNKKVLPITFTPYTPRGEKAMQSLCWSLSALDAKIIVQLPLHHTDFDFIDRSLILKGTGIELIKEALALVI